MKLNNLHKKTPLEMALDLNVGMQDISKRSYAHTWKDADENQLQPRREPPGRAGSPSTGHYDAYIEGRPRLKKYFGGSFTSTI